jgi:hypothetical protein
MVCGFSGRTQVVGRPAGPGVVARSNREGPTTRADYRTLIDKLPMRGRATRAKRSHHGSMARIVWMPRGFAWST